MRNFRVNNFIVQAVLSRHLRKVKGFSQTELAEHIGVHKNVLGKYEREEVKPSIDIAAKMASFFNVSLDYLIGKIEQEIDADIIDRVKTIQNLPDKDQEHILFTLDAMIRDAKSRFAYAS
jgi:transcriptional regulator with XRE-family HTH domain